LKNYRCLDLEPLSHNIPVIPVAFLLNAYIQDAKARSIIQIKTLLQWLI